MTLHFSLQPFHSKTLPVWMRKSRLPSISIFVNLVVPSPRETEPYNKYSSYIVNGLDPGVSVVRIVCSSG